MRALSADNQITELAFLQKQAIHEILILNNEGGAIENYKNFGQIIGFIVLIFVMALVTLRAQYSEADGPSILFPGEMTSGNYTLALSRTGASRMRSTPSIYN